MIATSALATITSTHGVRGVAVFDKDGVCVAHDLPAPYEPILVAEALRRITAAADVFTSLNDGEMSAFSAHCEAGSVIVRRLPAYSVVTLTGPGVNVSLLNVALNVFALNLSRTTHNAQTSVSDSSGTFASHSSQSIAPSGSYSKEQIPPGAVGREMVLRLLAVFVNYMGPAAKVVMKSQLAELGVSSRTLRESQYEDLIIRLSAMIPSRDRQDQFVLEARSALYDQADRL